jgi:hypothetical protein
MTEYHKGGAVRSTHTPITWKIWVYLVALVVSASLGFYWKHVAATPGLGLSPAAPPMSVFLSDPRATAVLTEHIASTNHWKPLRTVPAPGEVSSTPTSVPQNKADILDLYLTVTPPPDQPKENVGFVVISGYPDHSDGDAFPVEYYDTGSLGKQQTIYLGNTQLLSKEMQVNPEPEGAFIAELKIPHVVRTRSGEFLATVPAISEPVSDRRYYYLLGSQATAKVTASYNIDGLFESDPKRHGTAAFVVSPQTTRTLEPTDRPFVPGTRSPLFPQHTDGPDWPYFVPANLSTRVIVAGAQGDLANDQVDYMMPSTGQIQQDVLFWEGGDSLAPTLRASNVESVEKRNTAAFDAGIAFAISIAAALAIVDAWPRARKQAVRRQA